MNNSLQHVPGNKNRYWEIDSIRGISALVILVHHYTKYIYSLHQKGDVPALVEYGKYTVHFFFVISGLLIFMTLERATHPRYFIVSRFSRLYPAYWVCMALTAVAITVSPFYNYHPVTFSQFAANLSMFQHWMRVEDMDGIYWTLAVEMCFYVLIFLVFIFRQQKNIAQIGIAWLALMLLVHVLTMQKMLPPVNYYYYVPLLSNGNLFLAGIFFYKLKNNPTDKSKYWLILLCLGMHFIIHSLEEAIALGVIFMVLWLFAIGRLRFLNGPALYFFGTICYPLYLLHQYIGYEVINFLQHAGIENILVNIMITGCFIIALASLVTFTVERPAMKLLRKKLL
jgi:peptidoglycan/LPS O-acetylase OafA/YrhL